jgi:predicted nucleic acid-binding protein
LVTELLAVDAGPMIALARIEGLELLPRLFSQAQVTEQVVQECLAPPERSEAKSIRAALAAGWIAQCGAPDYAMQHQGLGSGEASTLALAAQRRCIVLVDDRLARRVATELGLQLVGCLGVLIAAKRRGLLMNIRPKLDQLAASGYFLSGALQREALRLAGEQDP